MKTPSKNSLRAALLTSSVILGAWIFQPAFAADMPMGPGMQKPEQCPMMDGKGNYAEHMQHKLDELGTKLHLKDNQQSAWKEYRGYLTESAADHQKRRETMRGPDGMARMRDLPAPERLQKMAERMKAGAEDMDKLAKRTATFYKTLSPEQQTIFDLYQRNLHPGGKRHYRCM